MRHAPFFSTAPRPPSVVAAAARAGDDSSGRRPLGRAIGQVNQSNVTEPGACVTP